MTASWKCTECGLVNFAADANCKRCGALTPVAGRQQTSPHVQGITLDDGYVLPPPPTSGGIWRDGKTLVMTKEALLPDRCVRCNAPANGYRLRRQLRWHHPLFFILIFVAMLLYLILALIFSKRATVDFPLCPDHVRKRRNLILSGWGVFLFAVVLLVVGAIYDYSALALMGIVLMLADIVWLVIAYRVVTVKKIDDRNVWLTGFKEQYLLQFPPLPIDLQP